MGTDQDTVQTMLIAEFRAKWAKSVDAVELGSHEIEEEGVHFKGKLCDPFAGNTVGNAYFTWHEIIGAISGKADFFMLKEEAAMSICEDGESFGSAELVVEDDGRVHFASDLEED